jgi:Fic family protein
MYEKPPFTISVKAADYLAKIVETVTRLEFGTGFTRDIKLHRKNRVRTIYASLAIEGNTLSSDEVTAVIEGKSVAGKQAEIKEVKNAYEAYDKIMTFDPYEIKDFLKAHELITDGLLAESGKFRSGDVGVFNGDVAVHVGARPQFVPGLMNELFGWAKESELHPVLKSAILHYEIETIHPFSDGNGRMGRLWQTLLLAKWKAIFEWIPMESVLYENRPQYYQAIEAARKANDSGVFIEFTLSALLSIIEIQVKHQNGKRVKSEGDIEKFGDQFGESAVEFGEKFGEKRTQERIIARMRLNPRISAKALGEAMSLTTRGIEKSISALKKAGIIERVGSAKGGYWVVKQ